MTNLRQLVKQRLLDEIVAAADNQLAVMVCDDYTLKLVSSALKIHEINNKGVGAVLNINANRERLPGTRAIYFLSPNRQSIEAIIKDYSAKKPQYGNAFLFTCGSLEKALLDKLGASKVTDFLLDFKEIKIDFLAFEERVALLGRKNVISTLFYPQSEMLRAAEVDRTAAQLASLCIVLKELPYIRYNESANNLSQQIAERFDLHISNAARELQDWTYNEMRSTLLILDRSLDPIAPLMHEYTYQAMVNDVLNVDGQLVTLSKIASGQSEDSKGPFILDDEEDLYREMRHLHISEVTQIVTARFNNFKSQNATAKFKGTDDVKEMLAVAKALPQFRSEMKKYTKHMTLAEASFDIFDEKKLREISHLEQDMATGIDEDGKKTTKKELQSRLVDMVRNKNIGNAEKLRLLIIYIISQDGIDAATRKQLFSVANFNEDDEEAVQNLVNLGVTLQSSSKKASAKVINADRIKKAKDKARSVPLELMRFTPFIAEIISDCAKGSLPKNVFKYYKDREPPVEELLPKQNQKTLGPVQSLRKTKWREITEQERKVVDEVPTSPRLIVFVAGGITFSEIREVYDIAAKTQRDIFICSSHTLTADGFLAELRPGSRRI